jgi:hypothetical protein
VVVEEGAIINCPPWNINRPFSLIKQMFVFPGLGNCSIAKVPSQHW